MAQVSKVLRNWKDSDGERAGFTHWCPACNCSHQYVTWRRDGKHDDKHPVWTFNGNLDWPTFAPSMRIFIPMHKEDGVDIPEETICHYILTDGIINFCNDCQHAMKGKKVILPELPSAEKYRYGDE